MLLIQTPLFQRYAEEDQYARARLGLLDALVERVATLSHSRDSSSRSALAEVSESAFFNYYPQSDDLLCLFVRL